MIVCNPRTHEQADGVDGEEDAAEGSHGSCGYISSLASNDGRWKSSVVQMNINWSLYSRWRYPNYGPDLAPLVRPAR